MASKFLHEAQRGASRGSIDLPLAIVAGLSIGFVSFMLPGDILARAVEMSRLPDVLPAAAPPLGTTARLAVAVAAAGAAFASIYVLLRLLGGTRRAPKERIWPEADTEREPETPRLRRSDVHPDAPARRPILAARELGEPAPAAIAPREGPTAAPEAPAPAQEEALELGGPGTEMLQPEPEILTDSEPAVEPPVAAEPVEVEPITRACKPEPLGDASIADLMARLERGLARRVQHKAAAAAAHGAAPEPAPAPRAEEWGDDRLRSAIENLQRMAARAG